MPDFGGRMENLDVVLAEAPEVFNHNVETVPRLYSTVRPQADYRAVAGGAETGGRVAAELWSRPAGWWGWERREEEVAGLLQEVAEAGVDMVTIGQYLRPSARHLPVVEYVRPEVFARYRGVGRSSRPAGACGPVRAELVPGRRELRPGEGGWRQGAPVRAMTGESLYSVSDAELQ